MKAGGPHLVTICPDGGQGASFRRFELAGAYATLALGAATLAYFGKAACFVCLPRPSGARTIAQYLPGYDVQTTDSKETVEDRTTEAYREGFLETLRGDPAAFDLWEGYWAVLFRERGAPNGPDSGPDGSGQTEGHPMSLDLIRNSLTAGPRPLWQRSPP